jgi:predicted deacylase
MSKSSFSIAGVTAAPGAREARVLELIIAGTPTQLPCLSSMAQDGPTVLVTAAIHGGEYVGTAAAMQLALTTDLAALRGQLVIAPIASMTAYAKRAIYIAPPDKKNLNRCFPGKADGSFADQLAHWIFTNLISKADFYVDCHGGDINEALHPLQRDQPPATPPSTPSR